MTSAGHHSMMQSAAKMPTARDYVQDGLIAMWDGIENAGWGVHNPSAASVLDLMTGSSNIFPSSRVGYVSAEKNAYRFTTPKGGRFGFGLTSPAVSATQTFETVWKVVAMPNAPSGNVYLVNLNYGITRLPIISAGIASFYWGGVGQRSMGVNCIGGTDTVNSSMVCDTANGVRCFMNGSQVIFYNTAYNTPASGQVTIFVANPNSWGGGTILEINSIRIYSRALAASEIAANYAVDKARFNLP